MARRWQARIPGPRIHGYRSYRLARGNWFDLLIMPVISPWAVLTRMPLVSTPREPNPLYRMWLEATGSAALPADGRNDPPEEVPDGS